MNKFLFFATFLFLTSCQGSTLNYGSTLQPWIGQSQERLQQAWGLPHDVYYITPEQKVWTYLEVSSEALNGADNPYSNEVYYPAISMPDFGFPSQPQYTQHYCKTLFTITNYIVTDYSFNGDDCVVNTRE
ncbi:MAG: hypothetical protein IJW72_01640 [Alphaproteobacteria bacterium]|nr:hypothetical protein [Alphaproteobacteria bacterium]